MSQAVRLGADLIALGDVPDAAAAHQVLTAAERQVPVVAAVGAPDAAQAVWWLTRLFYGQEREDVERRIDAVLRSVVCVTDVSRPEVVVMDAPHLAAVSG